MLLKTRGQPPNKEPKMPHPIKTNIIAINNLIDPSRIILDPKYKNLFFPCINPLETGSKKAAKIMKPVMKKRE